MPAGERQIRGKSKMGGPISCRTISVVVMVIMQLAYLGPWQEAFAEAPDDVEPLTSIEVAASAGTAAGLVEACGVDVTPIGSAFKEFLSQINLPSPSQQSLVEKFKVAEDTALSTLAKVGPSSCTSATGLMRETVRSLTKPAS